MCWSQHIGWTAASTETPTAAPTETTRPEDIMVIHPVQAEAIALTPAKAMEVATKVLRRSTRSAMMADEHTLYKAERLKAKKNLEVSCTSFSSFPGKQIISRLGRIDINLARILVCGCH